MTRADFNDFVQQLNRKLYGIAFRFLLNQEEAEDAVQETFIKLWKMGNKLDEYNSPDALATTMTKNYCIDQIRKKRNFIQEEDKKLEYQAVTSPTPHEQMEISETNKLIQHIINNLPETYKVLIRLRDMEGFTYEEIAEQTDQNINTLRVTISRARRLIRDEFNKHQYERG